MINAIGAMHATLRAKARPHEQSTFQVEVKKRRRKPHQNEEDDEPRRERRERGATA